MTPQDYQQAAAGESLTLPGRVINGARERVAILDLFGRTYVISDAHGLVYLIEHRK